MTESLPARPITPQERERAVQRLCAHFARDNLEMGELERRLDLAYAARERAELDALESDLPVLADQTVPEKTAPEQPFLPEPHTGPCVDPTLPVRSRDFMVAVMGGAERKGGWTPAKHLTVLAVMGGAGLDFRDATFSAPETHVTVISVMGGAEIIVPPGVHVESSGIAIMGAWETGDPTDRAPPGAPVVKVSGLVMMGAVEVKERLPGETEREAKKRIKAARKARALRAASGTIDG